MIKAPKQPVQIIMVILFAGCLITVFPFCAKDLSGEYSLEYTVPGHPYGSPFGTKIQVLQIFPKQAFVEVTVAAPTSYATSAGHLFGKAAISGDRLLLISGQDPDQCQMTIQIKNNCASIVSAENCSQYHGAGCDFSFRTKGLERIGPPSFSERAFDKKMML